jgi:hypothetical protein
MKAADIKPRDVIDGWTVTEVFDVTYQHPRHWDPVVFVLLTLERPDNMGSKHLSANRKMETRRSWYRADEEVEVSRGE